MITTMRSLTKVGIPEPIVLPHPWLLHFDRCRTFDPAARDQDIVSVGDRDRLRRIWPYRPVGVWKAIWDILVMPIIYERVLSVELCRNQPEALIVFGDNLQGYGKGGQAIIRDEPNAVGIPTKIRPSWDEDAFFTDDHMHRFREAAVAPFRRLREHLEAGGAVIWPSDGIGTGRAQLEARAPRIWAALQRAIDRLKAVSDASKKAVLA